MVSVEPLTPGLFGPVPSGRIVGGVVVGRPIARMLPQDGTFGEILRFVLDRPMPRETASHVLRVTAELFAKRPHADRLISYHDRSLHTGCIYKKAGFRKDGVSRAGTRRGSWGTRANREQAMSSEEASKRRWRLDMEDVRQGLSDRLASVMADGRDVETKAATDPDDREGGGGDSGNARPCEQDAGLVVWNQRVEVPDR